MQDQKHKRSDMQYIDKVKKDYIYSVKLNPFINGSRHQQQKGVNYNIIQMKFICTIAFDKKKNN